MQTKLTLRLDDALIERAKSWARKRGISLSQAVATLFEQLPAPRESTLTPWTQQLVGVVENGKRKRPTDDEIRHDRLEHLEKKHR